MAFLWKTKSRLFISVQGLLQPGPSPPVPPSYQPRYRQLSWARTVSPGCVPLNGPPFHFHVHWCVHWNGHPAATCVPPGLPETAGASLCRVSMPRLPSPHHIVSSQVGVSSPHRVPDVAQGLARPELELRVLMSEVKE